MPLVSFLMSNYKTPPAYLRRALDSILAQTLTDFEAVVINDGVKDESYELLLEYAEKDGRIRIIENETNLGLPVSLNKGIDACRGKYIARMDTDDICLPDRLEKQVEYMESHPDVMFAGAWADAFEEDENDIVFPWKPKMCPHEEYRVRLLFQNDPTLLHPTVIFRRDFLESNALRYSEDPKMRYTEDYEMWTRCADRGKAGILEQVVLKYRNVQADSRITVRHSGEMYDSSLYAQQGLLRRLGIEVTDEEAGLNIGLLTGIKPFDVRYKRWMDKIIAQNRKYGVYDQATLKRLLHERWYKSVAHGIGRKKTFRRRLRCFLTAYPSDMPHLAVLMIRRRFGTVKT